MKNLFFFIILLFFQEPLTAQTAPVIADLLQKIETAIDQENYETALQNCTLGLNIVQKNKLQEAHLQLLKGKAHGGQTNSKEAFIASQAGLNILKKLGKKNKLLAQAYYQVGQYAYETMDYPTAFSHAESALAIQVKLFNSNDLSLKETYFLLGKIHIAKGQPKDALSAFEKCVTILKNNNMTLSKEMGEVYGRLGESQKAIGNYEQATQYYEQALLIFDQLGEDFLLNKANIYKNIGYLQKLSGNFTASIKTFQQSAELYQQTGETENFEIGFLYNMIGYTYNDLGDYVNALDYFGKAEEILKKKFGEENAYVSWVINGKGLVYSNLEEHEKAIEELLKGLTIELKVYGRQHPNVAYKYNNLGYSYMMLEDYDTALAYHEKSLPIWMATQGENGPDLPIYYENVADCYFRMKQIERAITATKKLIDIKLFNYGPEHLEMAMSYNQLAYYTIERGDLTTGLEYLTKAQDVLKFDNAAVNFNDIGSPKYLLDNFLFKGLAYKKRYLQTQQEKDLHAAEDNYRLALELIQFIGDSYQEEESKILLSDQAHRAYEGCLELAFLQHNQSQAFWCNEKSKAQHLLQSITGIRETSFANVPQNLILEVESLKIKISKARENLFKAQKNQETAEVSVFQNEVFDLKQAYQQLIQQIERDYPAYYQLKYSTKALTLEEVQDQLLNSKTAIISYFLGEKNLYIFTIQSDAIKMEQVKIPDDFTETIENLRTSLIDADLITKDAIRAKDLYIQNATTLYDLLLNNSMQHLSPEVENLIINSDGILGYIPFEILLKNKPSLADSYSAYPYLLKNYNISYAYSATLLAEQQREKKILAKQLFAGFAPDYQQFLFAEADSIHDQSLATLVRSGQLPLPGALAEVETISEIMNGQIFIKQDASETNFKEKASQFRMLHLSMHTLLEDQQALYSKLLFTPTSDSLNDNFLHASELYNMKLNADLAVLSACNTGYGKLRKGEGIMSLSRAFTYAGVPSTVMSLWKVPDASTAKVMVNFYQYLKAGDEKNEALRKAKLDYLATTQVPEQQHPFYWAGFIATGNMESIQVGTDWTVGFWLLGFGILGGLIFGFYQYKIEN